MERSSRNLIVAAVLGGAAAMMAAGAVQADPVVPRWSVEKAAAWGVANPWWCGVNYIPANAINYTAMWDKTSFSPDVIRRELKLMTDIGMNCVRFVMQYKVYEDDPAYFVETLDKFLSLCDEAKVKAMPIFFDDCVFGVNRDPVIGRQPEPLEGWYAWAWSPSPGHTMVIDEREHPKLEKYVKDVLSRFKDDKRIFLWDLYNEPTSSGLKKRSFPLLRKTFKWAREVDPSQPISSGIWNNDKDLNNILIENSDIVTFHCYANGPKTAARVKEVKALAKGRPVICTEWMNRPVGSTVAVCIPIFKEAGVGCMAWGLVNGKTQTHLTYGHRPEMLPYNGEWQHDLYRGDFTPYDAAEIDLVKAAIGRESKQMPGMTAVAGALCLADELPISATVAPISDAKPMKFSPMIFGHFIEHFDNQVYGGLYWPGHPLSDEDGFRKDVIDALREIKCPIVRWPGGCYVSDYHWKCGIGPNRQPMWSKAWAVEDPNTFGTDEYVKWCRKVGCEPYICTNAGTGDEEEMSDWVEYCNLSVGKWGRQRIANGYEKPHDVLYWSVGNENWGRHEIGAKTVEQWGPLVREGAKMMRGTDRRIHLLAAALPDEKWTLPLLKTAGYLLDYVSVHGYYVRRRAPYLECMARTTLPEADIVRTVKVLEKAGFGGGKVGIAFDEWNLRFWHHPGLGRFKRDDTVDYEARRENDIAATYTMADALFTACFLNACLRHCDIVKIANFSPVVNTRGAIFVHDKGILKRTTYHVFRMYTGLLEPNVAPVAVTCGEIVNGKDSAPVVDAVLTVSDDGARRVLAVVNKSPDKAVAFDVSALTSAASLDATVLDGDSPDAYNDIGAENRVVPHPATLPVTGGKVTLAPHSLHIIKL